MVTPLLDLKQIDYNNNQGVSPPPIPSGEWQYFEFPLDFPLSYFCNDLTLFRNPHNAPVSIYLRRDNIPTDINYDAKLDAASIRWDPNSPTEELQIFVSFVKQV